MAKDIAGSDDTPLMKQYRELKQKAGDALLFFRMGDFYELFSDDAVLAARVLGITLTTRDKNKPNPTPMAGVPHHSAQGYIQKLLDSGYKVSIGEQLEDPSQVSGKSIVKRDVVRTFTPGVQFDTEGAEARYLAAWAPGAFAGTSFLACVDVSTGEALLSSELADEELGAELSGLAVKHLLRLSEKLPPYAQAGLLIETLPENFISIEQSRELLEAHYVVKDLAAFIPVTRDEQRPHAARALAAAVAYALKTQQQTRLDHLRLPSPLRKPRSLVLGPRSAQHLDLVPESPTQPAPTLYGLVNRTKSSLGARALRRWMLAPLKDPAEISARQSSVRELGDEHSARSALSAKLGEVYDLERICGRANARLANPRDSLALGRSLATLTTLVDTLKPLKTPATTALASELAKLAKGLQPLGERILREQREEAPFITREGGIFNSGVDPLLDRLLTLTADGERWLVELEARERQATGIPSLKVRYNRVFGYYIEITQAHVKNAPAHYQRKQTTMGAERFFTDELKKFEEEILTAGSRRIALEQELFERLLEAIRGAIPAIMDAARAIGELDALISLGQLAAEPGWSFPEIDGGAQLEIRAGRHPMVDQASGGRFVPNDLSLDARSSVLVITGPNMGGKSTVMRQTALIVILGQMGAPVPAAQARWGAFSSLYTRIGAHDAIARGQSTFMVEMSELAHILHHADGRSLIVLDEIGRGTSTYDGISVAWASLEWIAKKIRARTLFATHYHELTELAAQLPTLRNAHMAVESGSSKSSELRFLYELREGPSSESFGIHVARIAGLPKPVVDRAWTVLEKLEAEPEIASARGSLEQLDFFETAPLVAAEPAAAHPVLEALEGLKIDQLTPLQALNELARLKDQSSARA